MNQEYLFLRIYINIKEKNITPKSNLKFCEKERK